MSLRTKWALAGTAAWLLIVGLLIWRHWDAPLYLELNELGDFLAGVFAPLGFFWLVIGYFQQGEELQQNTAALKLQAEELAASVIEQRNLVAATNGQLKLAERAAEEQSRVLIRSMQCFVHLRFLSSIDVIHQTLGARGNAINNGHSVSDVSVGVPWSEGDIELDERWIGNWNAGGSTSFNVPLRKLSYLKFDVQFDYTDGTGVRQWQVFRIFLKGSGDARVYMKSCSFDPFLDPPIDD